MVDRSPPGGVTSRAEHGQHKTGDTHSDNTGTPDSHNRQSTVNVNFHVMLLCISSLISLRSCLMVTGSQCSLFRCSVMQ